MTVTPAASTSTPTVQGYWLVIGQDAGVVDLAVTLTQHASALKQANTEPELDAALCPSRQNI